MLGDSELQYCKAYHLSGEKDIITLSSILRWPVGKTAATHAKCINKGYIANEVLKPFVLANIKTMTEVEIKTIK